MPFFLLNYDQYLFVIYCKKCTHMLHATFFTWKKKRALVYTDRQNMAYSLVFESFQRGRYSNVYTVSLRAELVPTVVTLRRIFGSCTYLIMLYPIHCRSYSHFRDIIPCFVLSIMLLT
jgi:hypothetical protein